jgi:serpin B
MNQINKLIKDIIDKFESVECANHIFHENAPIDSFLEKIKDYKAGIDELKSAEQVNNWCSEATHGKIKKIIKEIPPLCAMILINAIYFKGEWTQNFDKALTRKRYFYNSKKEKNLVEFMQSEDKHYYFENEDIQAISLNYKKDNMEALIILPKNDYDINNYIKNFNQKEYNNILGSLNYEKVELYLPKFELEFEKKLNQSLQDLGMELAFSEGGADFFNLFKKPEEKRSEINYYIYQIIQKAYIKIDEKGTEAAAVTMIEIFLTGKERRPKKINIMDINHPFLFIIRNADLPKEHDILFIAKIEELKDKEKNGNENKSRSESRNKSRSRSRSRSNSKEE